MPERLAVYAASLVSGWLGGRTGVDYALAFASDDPAPVFLADAGGKTLALAIAALWEPETDPASDASRRAMEERLDAGNVRGPHLLWVPPRAAIPSNEPEASDFVQRVQQASGPLQPGGRAEVELPVPLQLAKMREEGGYASVIGGLSRWWTLITERVNGTFHVNSARMRRAPQSAQLREALFDRIAELSRGLSVGDATEFEASEAWTVQKLSTEPLGVSGFAIAQAPPGIDPSDGTLQRRLVRKRLKDANAALAGVQADVKGVALIGIYEYAEHENIGAFVKSLDPTLYAGLALLAVLVDGEVRPIFQRQ
jgi:hypothetical protein